MKDCSFVLISLMLASKWPPPPIGRSLGSRGPRSCRLIRLPPPASPLPTTLYVCAREGERDLPLLSIYSRGERGGGESACIAGRGRSSPPFVAAATQVPFTASNVIIKVAERCLAECQDWRSWSVIFNALNEKVSELFFGPRLVAKRRGVAVAVTVTVAAPPVSV